MCQPGDVLVTVKGAGVGKVNLAPELPACIGRQLMAVRARAGSVDAEFLRHTLIANFDHFRAAAVGATVPGLSIGDLANLKIVLPSLTEQRRIAARLGEELAAVTAARTAFEAQLAGLDALVWAILRETLAAPTTRTLAIRDCLREVTAGIGERWREFPVLGATRAGLAPAKEGVGKAPGRYKPVRPGTVFYNPMRILLGSIALLDDDDAPGITSPDYVAMTAVEGTLHPRWFYQWFRSPAGAEFIKSLTRGAVRERLLFNRLAQGEIPVPAWPAQVAAAAKFREIKRSRQAIQARLATLEKMPATLLRAAFAPARE
jgi:type I restriction enzyme S subunit